MEHSRDEFPFLRKSREKKLKREGRNDCIGAFVQVMHQYFSCKNQNGD